MKSSIVRMFVATAVAALFAVPGHAAQGDADVNLVQGAQASWSQFTPQGPTAQSVRGGYITVVTIIDAKASSGVDAQFKAEGILYDCLVVFPYTCSQSVSIPAQTVSPTTLTMDPLGNSATIKATVTDSASATHVLNLTLAKPQYLNIGPYNPNAWADPTSSSLGFNNAGVGISRSNYTVTGTIDTLTLTPPSTGCTSYCNSSFGYSFNILTASGTAGA